MFIIFNKEYRKFESILSDLKKKAKNSNSIVFEDEMEGIYNRKTYILDTVKIIFRTGLGELIVMDRYGNEVISIKCHYHPTDKLQQAKSDLYDKFLKDICDIYEKQMTKAKKTKAAAEKTEKEEAEKAKKEEAKRQAIFIELTREKILNDVLEKLRSL